MRTNERFSGHDKRVTLSLARCSAVCKENPELWAVLQKLPDLGYDLFKLPQEELELLYAEFDEELENKIKAEFQADSAFLIDLHIPSGTCPLCGYQGCRWIFKLHNLAGGTDIECGSECIITYGLSVKGAETAEAARAVLEAAIRRAIRALLIKEWHDEYRFGPELFDTLQRCLLDIKSTRMEGDVWWAARRNLSALRKLRSFYDRTGWLGTEKKWGEWCRLVNWAIVRGTSVELASPKVWVAKTTTGVPAVAAVPSGPAPVSDSPSTLAPVIPPPKVESMPVPKSVVVVVGPYNQLALELVFSTKEGSSHD